MKDNIRIVKVKLLSDGKKGMEYHAEDPRVKDAVTIKAFSRIVYPIPIPRDIQDLIQRMKKYLLHLSGYWQPEYDQYIDKGVIKDIADGDADYYKLLKLMQSTKVEEIARFKGKYDIIGHLINEWKLPIKISVKGINCDTNYNEYEKLNRGMQHIFSSVTDYINDDSFRKMESKQYCLDFFDGKEEMQERIEAFDDDQVDEMMTKIMEEKGMIVIRPEESEEESVEEKQA